MHQIGETASENAPLELKYAYLDKLMIDDQDAGVVDPGHHLIVVVLDGGVEKPWRIVHDTEKSFFYKN